MGDDYKISHSNLSVKKMRNKNPLKLQQADSKIVKPMPFAKPQVKKVL
jgi:hypothetical protein